MTPVENLKNIGPKMTAWLHAIDVHSEEDIERLGVVEVYKRLKAARPKQVNLNALWSLQGAMLGIPWNQLPPDMKDNLRRELEDSKD